MLMKRYAILLLIAMSISIYYFLGQGSKNLLLIVVMSAAPFMCALEKKRFDKTDYFFIIFLIFLLIVNLLHFEAFRISSYVYTCGFVFSFIFLKRFICLDIWKLDWCIKLIKNIIYAYFIVLILQQLCILVGIPPINQWGVYEGNAWKLCSLAPEPSHMVRFVFFFMYSYVELREIQMHRSYNFFDIKNEKKIWFAYFWLMTTCFSATGFLLVLVIFAKFISKRKLAEYLIVGIVCLFILAILFSESGAFIRTVNFLKALSTLNFYTIDLIDHSAAFRIVPFFTFFDQVDVFSLNFWFGQGMDVGKKMCQHYMWNFGVGEKSYLLGDVPVGGMMAFIIDSGIITFSFLVAAIYRILAKVKDKTLVLLWLILSLVEGINMQMFWSSLTMMMLISYFSHKRTY